MSIKKNLIFIEYPTPYWNDMLNDLHDKLNFEVYFIDQSANGHQFDLKALQDNAHYHFNFLKRISIGGRIFNCGFISIIRKYNPEIIISREFAFITLTLSIYKKLFRKKFKLVTRCDDSYDMVQNKHDFSLLHRIARSVLAPLVDDIILVEPRVVNWYQKRYKKGILFPILRKEEPFKQLLKFSIQQSNSLINKYGILGKKAIMFVGRFVKLKNIDILIEAFISSGLEDCVLFLVGNGPDFDRLKMTYRRDNVIFTGAQYGNELYAFYNFTSALCLISEKEAFGTVVNEALLSGSSVIVSDKAGASSLVNCNNGIIIKSCTKETVAKSMKELLTPLPQITYMENVRESKMPVAYETCFNNLVDGLTQ